MLLKEAIDKFTSWKSITTKKNTAYGYDRSLRYFCLCVGNQPIENITIDTVITYLQNMLQLGWPQNTIVSLTCGFRQLFKFWRLRGLPVLNEELIPKPTHEYKLPRVASEEKYQQILDIIPDDNKPVHIRDLIIVNLLWDTGARAGEISSLNISEIDVQKQRALIKTEKAKWRRPYREVFWTHDTNEHLSYWLETREKLETLFNIDVKALFIVLGPNCTGRRMRSAAISEMLRQYSRKAEIPIVNAHSFRHHSALNIIGQGGSVADVANILGHADIKSSMNYLMMDDKQLEKRYRQFVGK